MATGIERAVAAAGSQRKLARLVGVTTTAVQLWIRQGYVPATKTDGGRSNRILDVARATGVPAHDLNPWVYRPLTVPPTTPEAAA